MQSPCLFFFKGREEKGREGKRREDLSRSAKTTKRKKG